MAMTRSDISNEQLKLTAAWLNTMGSAAVALGALTPLALVIAAVEKADVVDWRLLGRSWSGFPWGSASTSRRDTRSKDCSDDDVSRIRRPRRRGGRPRMGRGGLVEIVRRQSGLSGDRRGAGAPSMTGLKLEGYLRRSTDAPGRPRRSGVVRHACQVGIGR